MCGEERWEIAGRGAASTKRALCCALELFSSTTHRKHVHIITAFI